MEGSRTVTTSFTGESEGHEKPFERDGMTRRSRGRKWHVVEVRVHRMSALRTRYCPRLEFGVGGLEWRI
ncbi:hypothetical protein CRG98_020828 [Punica granatum]|uniref:Uncharacterized protein n=1 Tax=Punica granatum TaxID=22663 RepID=A0A2I0JR40_PUNGR|nr:hypothetical protein CRG98_020828 [Punica granatum]